MGCVLPEIDAQAAKTSTFFVHCFGRAVRIAAFTTDIGALSTYTSMWGYESYAEREERRGSLQADEGWRDFLARLQPLLHTQQNRILIPTAFSPIR